MPTQPGPRTATAHRTITIALATLLACGVTALPATATAGAGNNPSPSPNPSSAPVLLGSGGNRYTPPSTMSWKTVRKVAGEPAVATATAAGGDIGLMWLNPAVLNFRFVPGYKVPEKGPSRPEDNKPSTWTKNMVAAFNGGFLLEHNAGGYRYNDVNVVPLRPGLATLTVSKDGTLHIVKWAKDMKAGQNLLAVRQNLTPIVDNGKAVARDGDPNGKWGFTDENTVKANRAVVGELPDGSIVFAYGADVTAPQMSAAVAQAGAKTAMVLDMNKSWPTGFYYDEAKSGKLPQGHRIQPRIWRDPATYYGRFMRDFVVATAQY